MPNQRTVAPEEIKRWTREFLLTDFWKLLLKPRLDFERERVSNEKRRYAMRGDAMIPYGQEFYLMALDDLEYSWLPEWKGSDNPDKEPDLEPPTYTEPRYPKAKSEE